MSNKVPLPEIGLTELQAELRKIARRFDDYAMAVGTLGIQEIHGHEFTSWAGELRYAADRIEQWRREAEPAN